MQRKKKEWSDLGVLYWSNSIAIVTWRLRLSVSTYRVFDTTPKDPKIDNNYFPKNETGWNPNCAGNKSLKPKNPIELFSSFMVDRERTLQFMARILIKKSRGQSIKRVPTYIM